MGDIVGSGRGVAGVRGDARGSGGIGGDTFGFGVGSGVAVGLGDGVGVGETTGDGDGVGVAGGSGSWASSRAPLAVSARTDSAIFIVPPFGRPMRGAPWGRCNPRTARLTAEGPHGYKR